MLISIIDLYQSKEKSIIICIKGNPLGSAQQMKQKNTVINFSQKWLVI